MRDLNQIVSENAQLALDIAVKRAAKNGERLNLRRVAYAMAKLMERRAVPGEDFNPETVYRTLRFLLKKPPRRLWRIDYLEAFASCVHAAPEDLLSLDSFDSLSK